MIEDLESNILEPMTPKQKEYLIHLMNTVIHQPETWENLMKVIGARTYEDVMNLDKEQASKLISLLVKLKGGDNNGDCR